NSYTQSSILDPSILDPRSQSSILDPLSSILYLPIPSQFSSDRRDSRGVFSGNQRRLFCAAETGIYKKSFATDPISGDIQPFAIRDLWARSAVRPVVSRQWQRVHHYHIRQETAMDDRGSPTGLHQIEQALEFALALFGAFVIVR